MLNDGESLLAAVPPHHRALFEQLAEASPDSSVMLPFSIWREAFINDADLDVARASYEQLSPEPYQQMTEPLAISTARIARLEALAHMCNRGVVCAVGPNLTATRRVNVSTDFNTSSRPLRRNEFTTNRRSGTPAPTVRPSKFVGG